MKKLVIWSEDDATPGTPGHKSLGGKLIDMFGELATNEIFKMSKKTEDGPDTTYEVKLVITSSYPGNASISVESP